MHNRLVASLATPGAKTIAVHASNQLSVWCAAEQKMAITALGHPFGAGEMTFPGTPGAFGLAIRIDVQNNLCDFAPICPFGIGVKEPQIRHKMLFIVAGQNGLRPERYRIQADRVASWPWYRSVRVQSACLHIIEGSMKRDDASATNL